MLAIRSQTGLTYIIIPYISHMLASGDPSTNSEHRYKFHGLGFLEFEDANSTDHVVLVAMWIQIPYTIRC